MTDILLSGRANLGHNQIIKLRQKRRNLAQNKHLYLYHKFISRVRIYATAFGICVPRHGHGYCTAISFPFNMHVSVSTFCTWHGMARHHITLFRFRFYSYFYASLHPFPYAPQLTYFKAETFLYLCFVICHAAASQ